MGFIARQLMTQCSTVASRFTIQRNCNITQVNTTLFPHYPSVVCLEGSPNLMRIISASAFSFDVALLKAPTSS